MKFFSTFFILLTALACGGIFCFGQSAKAMPVGTLLYRTSGGGQLYGYNTDLLLEGAKINCGHAGMYAGDVDGQEMVLEAVNNGIRLTPLKHFVNLDNGEVFLGAKIPRAYTNFDKDKIKIIRDFLVDQKLAYDIDFGEQKGPNSGQFTCVGLTEKIYESLNFGDKISSLDQLEYDREKYYIDITPDGNDNLNIYNEKIGDVFSKEREFSLIAKRFDPVGLAGNGLGRLVGGGNYFFFPYTQFLQPTLEEVAVDPETLSSRFSDQEVRGGSIAFLVVSQGLKNNLAYTAKASAREVSALAKRAGETFSRAKNRLAKIFQKEEKSLVQEDGWVLSEAEKLDNDRVSEDGARPAEIEPLDVPAEAFSASDAIIEVIPVPLAPAPVPAVLGVIKEAAATAAPLPKIENKPEIVKIKYVIDGDTVELADGRHVRYLGIDTPELNNPGAEDDDCLAWAARERNAALLSGREIGLLADAGGDMDKYGRILRYVYADGTFVNQVLAREGLGEIFFCRAGWENCPLALDLAREKTIRAAGAEAKKEKRGLYSNICASLKEKAEAKKIENISSSSALEKIETTPKTAEKTNPPLRHFGGSGGAGKNNNIPIPESEPTSSSTAFSGTASSTASSPDTASSSTASSTVENPPIKQTPVFAFHDILKEYAESDFPIYWSAADTASGSGLAEFEIEMKICSSSCSDIWQPWAVYPEESGKIFSASVRAGDIIYFRGRVRDLSGNESPWILASTSIMASSNEEDEEEEGGENNNSLLKILISEFATRGTGGAYDEFVELYNPSETAVDLSGWSLESRSAAADSDWKSRTGTGLENLNIQARGYLLLAPKDFIGIPDYRHVANWALADSGGALRLLNILDEEIDLVRWGEAAEAGSTQAEADLSAGGSLERKALATSTTETMAGEHRYLGNAYDTDSDNDFVWRSEAEPQNFESLFEPREEPAEEEPVTGEPEEEPVEEPAEEATSTVEEIDQFYSECKKAVSVNISGKVFGQTFRPEKDNLSAVALRLQGNYSTSRVFEVRVCAGEMLSMLGEEIEADWDCAAEGQSLIASWLPGEENIFASEPEKYNWRKFSFPSAALVPGEPYFLMIKSLDIKICNGFSVDGYLSGSAAGHLNPNVYDLAFRTYFTE